MVCRGVPQPTPAMGLSFSHTEQGQRDNPGVQNEKLILRKTQTVSSITRDSSMLLVTIRTQTRQ